MAQPKSIIFAVTTDLSYDQRMQRSCQTLAAAGYNVTLVGRVKPKSLPLEAEAYQQKRLKCHFLRGKRFYAEFNIRLFLYLLFHKADAFCAIDTDTLIAVWLAGKLKGIPVALDAHEYFAEVPELNGRPKVRKFWRKVEYLIIPRLTYAYTVSQSYAAQFQRLFGLKFRVIRNISLLEDIPKPVIWPGITGPYLIYIGALNAGRGLEESISAMRYLNCQLLICGDGDLKEYLEADIKKHRLQEKVILTGYQTPAVLKQLTAGAFAGLLLLDNKSASYYYSLANKFFDYIHAGIPQIAVAFPEYKIINNHRRVAILIEFNRKNLINAVETLLEKPELYKRLRNNTVALRKELNWQQEGKKLVDFWDRLFYGRI